MTQHQQILCATRRNFYRTSHIWCCILKSNVLSQQSSPTATIPLPVEREPRQQGSPTATISRCQSNGNRDSKAAQLPQIPLPVEPEATVFRVKPSVFQLIYEFFQHCEGNINLTCDTSTFRSSTVFRNAGAHTKCRITNRCRSRTCYEYHLYQPWWRHVTWIHVLHIV